MLTDDQRKALLKKLGISSGRGEAVDQFGGKAAADFGNFSDQPLRKSLADDSLPGPPDSIVARIQHSIEAPLKEMLVNRGKEIISDTRENYPSDEDEYAAKNKKIEDLIQVNYKGLLDAMKKAIRLRVNTEDTNTIQKNKDQVFSQVDKVAIIAEIAIDQCSHGKRNIEDVVKCFNELCDKELMFEPPQVPDRDMISKMNKIKDINLGKLDDIISEIKTNSNGDQEINVFLTTQKIKVAALFDQVINSSDSPELKEMRMEKIAHDMANVEKLFNVLNDIYHVRSQYDSSMPCSYDSNAFKSHGKEEDRPIKAVVMWLENQVKRNLDFYQDAPDILLTKLVGSLKGIDEPLKEYSRRVEQQKEGKMVDALQMEKEMKVSSSGSAKKSFFRKFFGNSQNQKPTAASSYISIMERVSSMEKTIEQCAKLSTETQKTANKYQGKINIETITPKTAELKSYSDKLSVVQPRPESKSAVKEEQGPRISRGRSSSR